MIAELVGYMLGKHKDLNLVPRIQVKIQLQWHAFNLRVKVQKQYDPSDSLASLV